MKVLSIDFDFFQNIPYDVLPNYPDGIDLPHELSNIVWESRYRVFGKDFERVEFDSENFVLLLDALKKQSPTIPIMIASSHVAAYRFINELLMKYDCAKTDLINIDLHHDILNNNSEVDCGNWIGHLLKEKKIGRFEWIAKPLSQEVYGISDKDMKGFHAHFDLSEAFKTTYDAIFICRSDPWLLPPFDIYFQELIEMCRDNFKSKDSLISSLVQEPRHIQAVVSQD